MENNCRRKETQHLTSFLPHRLILFSEGTGAVSVCKCYHDSNTLNEGSLVELFSQILIQVLIKGSDTRSEDAVGSTGAPIETESGTTWVDHDVEQVN